MNIKTMLGVNAGVSLVTQLTKLLLQFLIQTAFVRTLGVEYLGANGLFTNVLLFLSFAELGIGSSFSFILYKPIIDKNFDEINAIMTLFKRVYNFIGLVILILGSVITYFIPFLTNSDSSVEDIRLLFFLYLLSSVVSYFFTYYRTMFIANQQSYVDSLNQLIFLIIKSILQLVALIVFKSYVIFLVAQIITNVLSNLSITIKAKKKFEYLQLGTTKKIKSATKKKLMENVVGSISSKIGAVVVNGTDNILISKFVGLANVGFYSNYAIVVTGLTSLMTQVINGITASLGHLNITEQDNTEERLSVFNTYTVVTAAVVAFMGTMMQWMFEPFIRLWLGHTYLLPDFVVEVIVVNFVFAQFRPAQQMIAAYGLFWGYRYKSIVEALVNLVGSLLLVNFTQLGIAGVLLGTIIGNVVVNSWWDVRILFTGAFPGIRWIKYVAQYWVTVLNILFILIINKVTMILIGTWLGSIPFIPVLLIACVMSMLTILVGFSWNRENTALVTSVVKKFR